MTDRSEKTVETETEETLKLPIVVQTFFEVKEDDGNFISAFCKLCKPSPLPRKPIRGQYKVPSNFTKHISISY